MTTADLLRTTLRLRIDALLRTDPAPEPIIFDTMVDTTTADVDPAPAARGSEPMSDGFLPYYNRELAALRRLAGDFAEANPKVAGRLRLTPDAVDDPHVERLLEGVAFLAARAQQRLDDEFPEITDALLGTLFPHYLAPVPSARHRPVRLPAGPARARGRAGRDGVEHRSDPRRALPLSDQLRHDACGRWRSKA